MSAKKFIACALALAMLVMTSGIASAAVKNEIVYVNLNTDASVSEIYIVNRFDSDESEEIVDYGEYYSIQNLTDTSDLYQTLDTVQFTKSEGTFFYQGTPASKALPWQFTMSYKLDGSAISAEDLAGESGALEIQLEIAQGSSMYTEFFEQFMLSITITLDGELCDNVEADGATIANSGKDKLLTYTILPNTEGTYVITADVVDFELSDISINAVPMGLDLGDIDTSSITEKLEQLQSGIQQIDTGAGQLAGGASSLASGTSSLVSGAEEYAAGLDSLREGTTALAEASSSLRAAIDSLSSSLSGSESIDTSTITALLTQISTALSALQSSLTAYTETAQALNEDAAALQTAADALDAFSSSDISLLRTLLSRAAANDDASTYLADEIAALTRILDNAEEINGEISDLQTQAAAVSSEASAVYEQTVSFVSALNSLSSQISSSLSLLSTIISMIDTSDSSTDVSTLQSAIDLIDELDDSIQALDQGVASLQEGFSVLYDGMVQVDEGAQALVSGADTLEDGTSTLESSTSDMDEQVEEGVDEAIESITGGEYEPISFVDDRNEVEAVQFVIKLPGVSISEEDEEETEEAEADEDETILDRFFALFD